MQKGISPTFYQKIINYCGSRNRAAFKKDFVEQFIKKIVENGLMMQSSIDEVKANYPKNSWSIDFPSWLGEFNEKKGKKVMIIGSEPHIHYEFLQTVYGFNNERQASH